MRTTQTIFNIVTRMRDVPLYIGLACAELFHVPISFEKKHYGDKFSLINIIYTNNAICASLLLCEFVHFMLGCLNSTPSFNFVNI